MLRLLAKAIFGRSSAAADPWAPIVEAAIDKAVDGTDPRLRALPGYRVKLRGPVSCAAHFANDLGERFAPPIESSRRSYGTDPRPRAFFSSAERLEEVFSTSPEVQAFLKQPVNRTGEHLYAALAMRRSERPVLAPALRGDRIEREVQRILVSFDEHRVVMPSRDEAGLRRQLKERAFVTLVECALERMVSRRHRKTELEKRRALLRTKLRALRSSPSGLDTLSDSGHQLADAIAVERQLNEIERALRESDADGDTLNRNLADVCATLSRPDDFVSLAHLGRRLTQMNYLAREGDAEPADLVEFMQVDIRGRPSVSGVLASYPLREVNPKGFHSDRMRRALGVKR